MPWARLDDGFHDHPKVDGLSLAAVGLYTLCLTWAHRHRKTAVMPGHITEARVAKLAGKQSRALTTELLTSGLWEPENGMGGYVIHDFADYLPKERDPDERREAGKRGAAKRWESDGKPDGNLPSLDIGNDGSRASAPAYPTRPVPDPPHPTAGVEVAHTEDPTSRLLLEHVNAYPDPLTPSQYAPVRTAIAQQVGEGVDSDRIRAGLARMRERNLSARMLPECVVQASAPPPKRSTADERVGSTLAMAERFAAQEGVTPKGITA